MHVGGTSLGTCAANVTQTFTCPHCGAAVEYDGAGRSTKCSYCGSMASVPEALWQPVEHARAITQWKMYVLVFLTITLVLPTCASFVATVLGVGGGILAVFAPFVLRLLGGS